MLILLGLAGALLGGTAARSEPLRIALVIANTKYTGMPELAQCAASAAAVRDALHERGFEIIDRSDLGRGEFDAAIGALARRAANAPPAFAALYYCGYAVDFNGRSFLFPVSMNIARDSDILTQGVISKSLVDSLAHVPESAGVVVLDTFQAPGFTGNGMGHLVEQVQPGRYAVIGVANENAVTGPTPAAQAVRDQVAGATVTLDQFVKGMREQLAKATGVATFVVAATGKPSYLAGAPVVVPPPPPPPAQPAAVAAPPPVAPPAPPPPAPAPRQVITADDDRMSDQERRQVQAALATMGYYSGRIDSLFGPETRAAIRRYQFEIKADLTGYLTAEQATKLVNSAR
jgi:hypothetical protein